MRTSDITDNSVFEIETDLLTVSDIGEESVNTILNDFETTFVNVLESNKTFEELADKVSV